MANYPTYDAFISYASVDLTFADTLYSRLTAAGLKVWFDKSRLNPGCNWHKEIEAGCEASRVVLPVLTARWKLSDWTKFETYGAEAIIPLIVEGAFAETSTPPLTRFQSQAIDLTRADDASWDRLIRAIKALLAQNAPDRVARLADVRYAANSHFVGRERELLKIHEELHQNPTAVLTQGRVRAVTALGGVGKTTLARQYVEKFWRCYPQILWIDCRLGVETEFARLSAVLSSQSADTNVAEKAQLALRELQKRVKRLLIIDNAEDEKSIQLWIPKTGSCRTLITSRFAGWSAAVKSIHLYVLEPEPARTLLVTRAGLAEFADLSADEQSACDALAKQLGYLPLALEQAAAYIEQQRGGFEYTDYLRLYKEATRELLAAGVLGSTEYPDSVITTWKSTTAKLEPGSRAILRLCSFLSPTPLPLTALLGGLNVLLEECSAVVGAPFPTPAHAEFWVRDQVRQLRAYSMVEADAHSISLHPLVQKVQQLELEHTTGQHRAMLARSLKWINQAFLGDPAEVRNWPTLSPLAAHARSVVGHAHQAGITDPTSRLMSDLGTLFFRKAQYSDAEPLMRLALAMNEQSYGADHRNVAVTLNNLAALLQTTNRLAEAELLTRRAIAIDEQSYGADHPDVARDLNHLAILFYTTNRLAEAEPLMRRSLEINERSYGANHPHVSRNLNSLARLLQATNRLEEAEPLLRRALAINEQSYGVHHPNVANGLNNLGRLLIARYRIEEAEPLLRRALEIAEQLCGADHPDITEDLNILAKLLHAMDRSAEAEPLMRRSLEINERSYGAHHPQVAISLSNLVHLLQAMDRLAEAELLMRRQIAHAEQFYGAGHANVAIQLSNLAKLLWQVGRSIEAEPLSRRAIAIFELTLGMDDPASGAARSVLTRVLRATDRYSEAAIEITRAVKIFALHEQHTGHKHALTATVIDNFRETMRGMNLPDDEIECRLADAWNLDSAVT